MTTPPDFKTPVHSGAMSDHLVRVGHLKALQRQRGWTDSELGRQCGRTPQQVRSWFSGTRQIGERLARALEERLQLSRYALDSRNDFPSSDDSPIRSGGHLITQLHVTRKARDIPVIRWDDIKQMLDAPNGPLKTRAPHLETFSPCSPSAKFIEMPDESMAPDFMPGDHILLDPTESPHAGDVVLVRIPSGEHFVRHFRPRTAYIFDAVATNPNYQALSSKDDGATVVGVMVEHRRYRQNR